MTKNNQIINGIYRQKTKTGYCFWAMTDKPVNGLYEKQKEFDIPEEMKGRGVLIVKATLRKEK